MKKFSHLSAYGLIVENGSIVLIKKAKGPYTGLLDLPGGTIDYGERPIDTVVRELKEEVGIEVIDLELFDADSILYEYNHKGENQMFHHIGVFFKINSYNGIIQKEVQIDEFNNDSLGAEFYPISKLTKNELSPIALIEIKKLGYDLK